MTIDVDNLPLDDTRTFELLSTGETTGVFQLEGAGMRRYVKELKPTEVRDLAAMVALFRPGPMANIPSYIRRKHGEEAVTYLHPSLEPALRDTYGIFVYQEDIMTAAIAMADYTGPEADNLCYAIRKKKEKVLHEHEAKFKAGAKRKGISPAIVDQVFAAFEPFARYGFNKAHATCYGLIAYQTAYLKANYPIEFMTAVLNGFRGRAEKVAGVVAECHRLGIEVRPPDVQHSQALFTVETDAARGPRGDPLRPRGGEERGRGRHRIDRRGPRGALRVLGRDGRLPLARRPGAARGPADGEQARPRVAHQGGGAARAGRGRQPARPAGRRPRHRRAAPARRGGGAGDPLRPVRRPGAGGPPASLVDGAPSVPEEDEIPQRERLRWEKELLGLYLTEHPLGEIAGRAAGVRDRLLRRPVGGGRPGAR